MFTFRRFLDQGYVLIILLGVLLCAGQAQAKEKVIIFHAGSLTVPFAEMEKNFEAMHPEIDILLEGGGSTKMARMISEVGKRADIMASADYKIIDNNLIPDFAAWNIRFASNQLVLCYTDQSKYADTINSDNWYDILLKDDVAWGHSDPNLDPCGYRSLMVMQLAEKFYGKEGLYQQLVNNRSTENMRPKSVELVNLLKTGHLDYAWEYLSVAVQHDLHYVTLDDHLNLGNYRYDQFYKQALVEVSGKEPGTTVTKRGKSCTYGLTMIKDAPNPEGAVRFLSYLLDPDQGLKILREMGQPPFVPARVAGQEAKSSLPQDIQGVVEISK